MLFRGLAERRARKLRISGDAAAAGRGRRTSRTGCGCRDAADGRSAARVRAGPGKGGGAGERLFPEAQRGAQQRARRGPARRLNPPRRTQSPAFGPGVAPAPDSAGHRNLTPCCPRDMLSATRLSLIPRFKLLQRRLRGKMHILVCE